MQIFKAARRSTNWMRAALALLVLAFALDSVAHAAHTHDSTPAAVAHHVACGYCATFATGLGGTPVHTIPAAATLAPRLLPVPQYAAPAQQRLANTAQARAPPVF